MATGGVTQAQFTVELFSRALSVTPFIVPPTWVYPAARCGGLGCAFVHAEKFICMGNRKNRLTTTKLISRRARTRARPIRVEEQAACEAHRSCVSAAPILFFLSYSPSDMGLPRSTLRWARVRIFACREIHLYGESKKSTHGHQTHLPARTQQRHLAPGLFPPPRPPTPARARCRSKSRVSALFKSRVSTLLRRNQTSLPRALHRPSRASLGLFRMRSFT